MSSLEEQNSSLQEKGHYMDELLAEKGQKGMRDSISVSLGCHVR
jgi:hypothetical protein